MRGSELQGWDVAWPTAAFPRSQQCSKGSYTAANWKWRGDLMRPRVHSGLSQQVTADILGGVGGWGGWLLLKLARILPCKFYTFHNKPRSI